jgi:hypothetical protein
MNDAYFCWLIGLIGDDYIERNYQKLLWKLYSTDYLWELDYDRNRAADGLFLRTIFAQETRIMYNFGRREGRCTMLEMLIALARRAEDDIMHDPDYGDRTGYWFWTMIQNLGLDMYDDGYYFEEEVDRILDVFVHHRYEKNGMNGGAFPVRTKARDLRKTDLWWQMNAYLEENYPV